MSSITRMDEVGDRIYRIATFEPKYGISINQFLIDSDMPTLIHTGTHQAYESVRQQIAKVLDPAKLAYIVVPHFEADECGGMGRFVSGAPGSTLVCSELGAMLNLSGWDFKGPFKGMRDGQVLDLGRHKLRFLETPHVHHWDSMMVVEETTNCLFPADLFIQPGEQSPLVRENLGREMCAMYREIGIFGAERPVLDVVNRVSRMDLRRIHPMHGGSIVHEAIEGYYQALRTNPFCYGGKVFGRALPT